MTDAVVNEKTNGHRTKGRTPPPLPTFTFKDSGITVGYRRLGPFTMEALGKAIRKEKAAPVAPLNEVDYGNGKVTEPNLSDPAYQKAVAAYDAWVEAEASERMVAMVITRCIEPIEIDAEAVAYYRETASQFGLECEGDDKAVYIKYIAITTAEDLSEITVAVVSRSQPTPEAIQAAVTSFPRDVSGT